MAANNEPIIEFLNDNDLPPLVDPSSNNNDLPPLIYTGRSIAMPSECTTNPLQRSLADSIIRMVAMDELRIILACGAKVKYLRHFEYKIIIFYYADTILFTDAIRLKL
jgi:hypothetical protein